MEASTISAHGLNLLPCGMEEEAELIPVAESLRWGWDS